MNIIVILDEKVKRRILSMPNIILTITVLYSVKSCQQIRVHSEALRGKQLMHLQSSIWH